MSRTATKSDAIEMEAQIGSGIEVGIEVGIESGIDIGIGIGIGYTCSQEPAAWSL